MPASTFRQTFRSLRHRNYRLYFFGQLVSLHGTWMQTVAQAWLVYRLTNSSFMLGLVAFCSLAPVLVLGLLGGVAADRYRRRKLLIAGHTAAMVHAAVLALLTFGGWITAWQIVVLALILGVVHAFEMPARHAFITELVPREDLPNAIPLNSSVFNVARFVGPSIAGWLVAFYGEGTVFLVNAASFAAVLVALLMIRVVERPAAPAVASVYGHLLQGLEFAWRQPRIRAGLLVVGMISLVAASVTVLMPVFAKETFSGGPKALGLLLAAIGMGALAGALRLAYRLSGDGLERSIGVAAVGAGICVLVFSFVDTLALALPILVFAGFAHTTTAASTNTLIQLTVDDRLRGRVMSLFSMIFIGLMPLGSLLAGALAQPLGAPATVGLFGLGCTVAAAGYLYSTRRKLPASG
jgi:MFS family permease